MPLEIVQERREVEGVDYQLAFWWNPKEPHYGYAFDCDKDGNVDESKLQPIGLENLQKCRTGMVDGTPIHAVGVIAMPWRRVEPAIAKCEICEQPAAEFDRHCGAWVCNECEHHQGLARCYCGWSVSGGDGRAELVEMGETIEADDWD